jgi:hypothetical protein
MKGKYKNLHSFLFYDFLLQILLFLKYIRTFSIELQKKIYIANFQKYLTHNQFKSVTGNAQSFELCSQKLRSVGARDEN